MTSQRTILLARLDAHQAKALDIILRGDSLLAPGAIPNPPLLIQSRWELTRVLGAYQAFKHHELFNPIIREGPPDKARLAEQMKGECVAIGDAYRQHVMRCTNLDIPRHWDSYRPAVVKLLARIKSHMARELWVTESLLLTQAAAQPLQRHVAGR